MDASLSVLDSNNSIVEDAGRWASIKVQTDPEFITDFIYKHGCKDKKMSWKYGAIPWIMMMGNRVPRKVDEYLKILIKDEDEAVLSLIGSLILYKNQNSLIREELLKSLINHKNRDISGFADFLLNGLHKSQ